MLRKNQNIRIFEGNTNQLKFEITLVHAVEIVTKRNSYTDTASIIFPNKLSQDNGAIDLIKIGDKVEIRLGYFPRLTLEFTGFINYVNRDSPLVIECEDEVFLLKRISLPSTTFRNTTISEVIDTFFDGQSNILDAEIGDVRIEEGATLVNFLDLLKTKYGILSFFQDGVLNINTSLTEDNRSRVFLVHEQKNVPLGSTDLKFQQNSDLPIISHGVSIQNNGTKIELFATYQDNVLNNNIIVSEVKPIGFLNTLKVPNLSRPALESLIRRRLPLLFYSGVTGSVTTFGEPSIKHGDTIQYVDDRIPEKNGFYRVNEVVKQFNLDIGFKQRLVLGARTRV